MPKKEALLTLLKEYLEKDEIIEDSIYGLFVCYRQGKWSENREGILVITSKRILFFSVGSSGKGYLQEIPYEKITYISYKRGVLANNSLEIILGRDREINRDSHQLLQKGLEITLEPERAAMTGKFSEAFAKKLSEKVGLELRIIDRRRQERNLVLVVLVVVASIAFFRIYNAVVSPRRKKAPPQPSSKKHLREDSAKITAQLDYEHIHRKKQSGLLWDYKTDGTVTSVSITPDGSYITVGSYNDGNVYLFRRNGNLLWEYETGWVNSVSITPDGSYIAVGSGSSYSSSYGNVYLFRRNGNLLWEYKIGWVESVSITPDGSYIVAEDNHGNVYLFDRNGNLLWGYKIGGMVESVSITPDGSYIVAGGCLNFGYVCFFKNYVGLFKRKGRLLWRYNTDSMVESVSITPDGSYIVAEDNHGNVYLFDRNGNLLWKYKTNDLINSISITSDGSYITVGVCHRLNDHSHGYVYLFDKEGNLLWKYKTDGTVFSTSITPDGSYIVAGSGGLRPYTGSGSYHRWFYGYVHLLNRNGSLLWKYKTDDKVISTSITPDGSYIVAGTYYFKVYLFTPSKE